MASSPTAVRLAAVPLAFMLLFAGVATAPVSAQVCNTAGVTTTCNVGDTVGPLYQAPATQTLILQGGGVGNTLFLTGPLELSNTAGSFDLTLDASGFVEASGINSAARIIYLHNLDGSITSNWGADVLLRGTDTTIGIEADATAALVRSNRVSFGGQLEITNTALITNTTGIILRTSLGDGVVELLAGGAVVMTGGDASGVVASNSAGGNATVDVQGNIFMLGVADGGINAGALATSVDGGNALVSVSGHIEIDNRPFAANGDGFAAFAIVSSGNGLARAELTGSGWLESWGSHSGGLRSYNADNGDASVEAFAGSDIYTHGDYSDAIGAVTDGIGNVLIRAAGAAGTEGQFSDAIYGHSANGTVTVDSTAALLETTNAFAYGIRVEGDRGATVNSGAIHTLGDAAMGLSIDISTGGPVTVDTTAGAIETEGYGAHGVEVHSPSGSVNVTTGDITTSGGNFAIGALIEAADDVVLDTTAGSIATAGTRSFGVLVTGTGSGDREVHVGDIATTGEDSDAVLVESSQGNITLLASGNISTAGNISEGLAVESSAGTVSVQSSGTIQTQGDDARGIDIAAADITDVTTTGQITTSGDRSEGIAVIATAGSVAVTTAGIATSGNDSGAVRVESPDDITIDTTAGAIVTTGSDSPGVFAGGTGAGARNVRAGAVTTSAADSDAVRIESEQGDIDVEIAGALLVTGQGARAVAADARDVGGASGDVAVQVMAGAQATGEWGAAVSAISALGTADVTVGSTGVLLGGWDSAPGSVNPATTFGAAGVILDGGADQMVTLNNAGSIGALSDRAVLTNHSAGLQLQNSGTLTGYLVVGDGADLMTSTGIWNLRHFADSNGDATRDVEHVARTDFGGGADAFVNDVGGTLRLANIAAPGSVDAAYAFVPAGVNAAFHAPGIAGVEQGQLLRLERFVNRGTISLADVDSGGAAPVAGDVLLITSGTVDSAGVLTPGAAPGVFVSDGGALRLDTVLNEGGANSRSDLLVVDAVSVGPGGATRIFVNNAGGLGAATVDAGIKLVDVLGGNTASAINGFTLGAPVMAGPYAYLLYRSAPSVDDGDWYLRTQLSTPPGGTTPTPPTQTPPGPPPTTFRPEAPLLASLPNLLRNYDLATVATYQRRVGGDLNEAFEKQDRRGRSWLRAFATQVDTTQTGVLAPTVGGHLKGMQFGFELPDGGLLPRGLPSLGLYAGRVDGTSDVSGFAIGVNGAAVGSTDLQSTFAGLYGTHRRKSGAYFDFILQRSSYKGEITAVTGTNIDVHGTGLLMSFELGKPLRIGRRYALEPQLQLIGQSQSFDPVAIPNADVEQRSSTTLTGRVGLRFSGTYHVLGVMQPYLRVNVWKGLPTDDVTRYSADGGTASLATRIDTTNAEGAFGVGWAVGRHVFLYAEGGQLFPLDDGDVPQPGQGPSASLGVRVGW